MTAPRGRPDTPDPARGVYGISVAADLVGTGVQNLRVYERRGLLDPQRTDGGTRLYSEDDITRLRRIADLLTAGLNLAGIAMVLELEEDNARLRDRRDHHDRPQHHEPPEHPGRREPDGRRRPADDGPLPS